MVNSPHNPSGRVFTRAELEAIAAVCIEHDLVCVSDEVYEHLVYDGEHIPPATLPGMADRTLTISSIGKSFSFTGWKVGWACGSAELVGAVRTVKQFLTFAGGTPLQHASAAALLHGGADVDALAAALRRQARPPVRRPAGRGVRRRSSRRARTSSTSTSARTARRSAASCPQRCGVVAVPTSAFYFDPDAGRSARALRVLQARRGHRRGCGAAGDAERALTESGRDALGRLAWRPACWQSAACRRRSSRSASRARRAGSSGAASTAPWTRCAGTGGSSAGRSPT